MTTEPTYTPIDRSLCMAQGSDYKTYVALNRCAGVTPAGLYLVTLSRRVHEHHHPVTSLHYVLAPSEEEAIAQCDGLAFPEVTCAVLDPEHRAQLTTSAVRLPLIVRGWGTQPF